MKTLLLCVMAMPLVALAASNSPDASFYKKAAEAGISEVDLGNLAEQKSPDQQVKDFGAMMVKDGGAARPNALSKVARSLVMVGDP